MAEREILQLGDRVLWETSATVLDVASAETARTIVDLSDTLAAFQKRHGYGRGIAAPQIGILTRVIFIRAESVGFDGPLVNPEIVWRSGCQVDIWDNCFSFPDLTVRVARDGEIRVRYLTEMGDERVMEVTGELSELLQHEIDHLDGILATDRAKSPRDFMTRSEWLRQFRP